MGTRTAPAVGVGTQTNIGATVHLIDASGDFATDYVPSLATSDLVDIESWAAAYQAGTQASVYGVSFTQDWFGEADPDNADNLFRAGIGNGINSLIKNIGLDKAITPRLYSPVASTMQGNQDIPLLLEPDGITPTPLGALVAQYLVLLGAGYALDSVQFTGRRERKNNPRVRA